MSVLIKGLIMPHCCDVCSFSDWSNLHQTAICKVNYYKPCFADHSNEFLKRRSDSCPLTEIPEPHGDLIDRNALGIGEYEKVEEDTGTLEISLGGLLDLYHKVKDATTVIEAEGRENYDD